MNRLDYLSALEYDKYYSSPPYCQEFPYNVMRQLAARDIQQAYRKYEEHGSNLYNCSVRVLGFPERYPKKTIVKCFIKLLHQLSKEDIQYVLFGSESSEYSESVFGGFVEVINHRNNINAYVLSLETLLLNLKKSDVVLFIYHHMDELEIIFRQIFRRSETRDILYRKR